MTPPSLPPIPAAAATEERGTVTEWGIPVAVETAIQEHADAWFRAANPAADMIAVQMRSDALRLAIARALQAARDEERERCSKLVSEYSSRSLENFNGLAIAVLDWPIRRSPESGA